MWNLKKYKSQTFKFEFLVFQETTYNILNIAAPYGKEALLNAMDTTKRPLLDLLIDYEFKDSVSHPSIQSYVSELWTGLFEILFYSD